MRLGTFNIHRKEQWDLNDIKPIICIHKTYDGGNGCRRIFCLGFSKRKPIFDFSNPFKYRF